MYLCHPRSQVDLKYVLGTGLFSLDTAATHPGWLAEPRGTHVPETIEYGVTSFVFRARKPFHPARLARLLDAREGAFATQVVRSKGFVWLATRMQHYGVWAGAGSITTIARGEQWWAERPRSEWPVDDAEFRESVLKDWVEPFGDRAQLLVVIGVRMREADVRAELEACLLSDEELALGPAEWSLWPDALPEWREPSAEAHDHSHEKHEPSAEAHGHSHQ